MILLPRCLSDLGEFYHSCIPAFYCYTIYTLNYIHGFKREKNTYCTVSQTVHCYTYTTLLVPRFSGTCRELAHHFITSLRMAQNVGKSCCEINGIEFPDRDLSFPFPSRAEPRRELPTQVFDPTAPLRLSAAADSDQNFPNVPGGRLYGSSTHHHVRDPSPLTLINNS